MFSRVERVAVTKINNRVGANLRYSCVGEFGADQILISRPAVGIEVRDGIVSKAVVESKCVIALSAGETVAAAPS